LSANRRHGGAKGKIPVLKFFAESNHRRPVQGQTRSDKAIVFSIFICQPAQVRPGSAPSLILKLPALSLKLTFPPFLKSSCALAQDVYTLDGVNPVFELLFDYGGGWIANILPDDGPRDICCPDASDSPFTPLSAHHPLRYRRNPPFKCLKHGMACFQVIRISNESVGACLRIWPSKVVRVINSRVGMYTVFPHAARQADSGFPKTK
jgi:hypothetical protein